MPTLKQLINRYLYTTSFILVFLSVMIISIIQLKIENQHAYAEGLRSLEQIEQIMRENQQELEQELIQYSALESLKKDDMLQTGIKIDNIKKLTTKTQLSHIFSHFRVNPNISYFAIDSQSGLIVGASDEALVGLDCTKVGFPFTDITHGKDKIYAQINGTESYCIFKKIDSSYVTYVIPTKYLYHEIPVIICILFLCMLLIAAVLTTSFNEYMRFNIVNKIHKINELLSSITDGNLKEVVDVRNVYELSELSTHINTMVQSLFSSNSKLTYILSRTNIYLGTYEYSFTSNYVKFSEYIPTLFSLDEETLVLLSTSRDDFKNYIDSIRSNNIPDEQNVYEVNDKYIQIEEILEKDNILGVAIDVTDTIKKRKKLVQEIHLDTLTGLYNHKGIEMKLDALFSTPESLGSYALIIIKADGLAKINASYGPDNGDLYLKKIANIITDFGIRNSIAARQWGGEFILFLYGYDNEKDVTKAIDLLTYIQNHTIMHLNGNIDVPISFSFGYRISSGLNGANYQTVLKEISESNYTNTTSSIH